MTAAAALRRGGAVRVAFISSLLVAMIQPVSAVLGSDHSRTVDGLAIAGAATFATCYVLAAVLSERDHSDRVGLVLPAILLLLSAVLSLAFGSEWLMTFVFTASAFGAEARIEYLGRATLLCVGVEAAVILVISTPRQMAVILLLATALVALSMNFFGGRRRVLAEQHRARELSALLAASEERLRFSRELHDVLGHSLTLLTLKSRLAAHSLHTDPDRAARELDEMQEVCRHALVEVREAVCNNRQPTLDSELARARHTLETAGIKVTVGGEFTLRDGQLSEQAEAALASVLREAATNIVRHSTARRCRISLSAQDGGLLLEVANDGVGAGAPGGNVRYGNGLHGLGERLATEQGRLEAASTGTEFRLRAWIPTPAAADNVAPSAG